MQQMAFLGQKHTNNLMEYYNGTTWILGQADDPDTMATHVVIEVVDVNTFKVSNSGRANLVGHGLTVGQYYFTSDTVAGAVTSVEPNDYSNPMFRVADVDNIDLVPWRPSTTSGGSEGPQGPQGVQGYSSVQIVTALPGTPDPTVVYIVTG